MIYVLTLDNDATVTYESSWNTEDGTVAECERDNPDRTVTDIRPATVRETLVYAYGDDWKRSIDHIVTRLDEYPAKVPSIVFRFAQSESIQGYGDTVSVANYRVLADQWSEYDALDTYGPYSDVSAITLALDAQAPADLLDVIKSLEDYPLLSDDEHSQVETELIDEHWDSYGRNDTLDAVAEILGLDSRLDLSDYAAEIVDTLTFNGLISLTGYGEYPEIEDYSSVRFGAENVARWIKARYTRTVTLPHYGREYRFDLRESALVAR